MEPCTVPLRPLAPGTMLLGACREAYSTHAEAASQQTPSKPADKPAASSKAGKHEDEVMFSKLHVQEGQPAHKKAKKPSKQQLLRDAEAKAGDGNNTATEVRSTCFIAWPVSG